MPELQEGQVLIPNARLGYPKLFKPEAIKKMPDSKPRYGCAIYLPKSDKKTKAAIDAEITRLAKLKFKGKVPKARDLFIQDGDEDGDENTAGNWVISANRAESQGRPQVIDRSRKAIDSGDGSIYAGCYCNFLIGVYVPANWDKICGSLEVVQFVKDGEPFGAGRVDVDAVMPNLGEEDEDDDI
jgi:hypothetical protein